MKPETEKLLQKASRSIRARELQFKKHGGVHGAFAEHFIKTKQLDPKFHSWLVDAFDERIQGDYEVESQVDSAIVKTTIQQAREFLQVARQYLANQP